MFNSHHDADSTGELVELANVAKFPEVHTTHGIVVIRTNIRAHTRGGTIRIHNAHASFSAEDIITTICRVTK